MLANKTTQMMATNQLQPVRWINASTLRGSESSAKTAKDKLNAELNRTSRKPRTAAAMLGLCTSGPAVDKTLGDPDCTGD
jgi:hypothetical protein